MIDEKYINVILTIQCDTQYNDNDNNVKQVNSLNVDETISGLVQELRRGTLILLVLSQLETPMYGYNLIKILEESGIPIEANTLYPLMRRLESQGLLKSEWETSETKPRKYYVMTEDGKLVFEKVKKHWYELSNNVNSLLEGNKNEG